MTRILIVDDNPHVRNALRICLQMNQGHDVCGEAENGQDGIELARQLKPDIVLLDYAMPNMNGLEAARLISASMPQCGSSSSSSGSSRRKTSLRAKRSEQSASRQCGRILLMSTSYSASVATSCENFVKVASLPACNEVALNEQRLG
jgi:CheY-like chemotaxis protein